MLVGACPHLPSIHRPVRQPLARHQAAIRHSAVKHRRRGWKHIRPQFGVDAVGGNDDRGFRAGAVGECDARTVAVLSETHGAVSGMNNACGQVGSEEFDQVGAMHAKAGIAGRVSHLHRRDRRAIMAKIARVRTHARTQFLDGGAQPHALQMTNRIRRHINARANFTQRGRLFIHSNFNTLGDQGVGGE